MVVVVAVLVVEMLVSLIMSVVAVALNLMGSMYLSRSQVRRTLDLGSRIWTMHANWNEIYGNRKIMKNDVYMCD